MQNRAIEGDEVALQILPPSQWFISGSMLERGKTQNRAEENSPLNASPADAAHIGTAAVCSSPGLESPPLGSASSPAMQRYRLKPASNLENAVVKMRQAQPQKICMYYAGHHWHQLDDVPLITSRQGCPRGICSQASSARVAEYSYPC